MAKQTELELTAQQAAQPEETPAKETPAKKTAAKKTAAKKPAAKKATTKKTTTKTKAAKAEDGETAAEKPAAKRTTKKTEAKPGTKAGDRGIPGQGKDHWQIPGPRLYRNGQHGPYPGPARQHAGH